MREKESTTKHERPLNLIDREADEIHTNMSN